MSKKYLKINIEDTVIVALENINKGEVLLIDEKEIVVKENITFGHKIAIKNIAKGTSIIKYGHSIGTASLNIEQGEWVHTHNCVTGLNEYEDYTYNPLENNVHKIEDKSFYGYLRKTGKVGIRNEIWILPTVGCVNGIVNEIEKQSQKYLSNTIKTISAFNHPYGCSQVGEDQDNTRKILADLASHPNATGVLLVGLGCENSGIDEVKKQIKDFDKLNIETLICQDVEDEIKEGLSLIEKLIFNSKDDKQTKQPLSKLIVGLKCGGSDGLSGITANPTVGVFSDLLVQNGGTTILTEVPEMFGAEQSLLNRCKNDTVYKKMVNLINGFKEYYVKNNSPVYENPSPGNKLGGITTLEDKSLGCTQKSGSAEIVDVLNYGEIVTDKGLNILEAPGNDLVASTALAAAGAQIVLFTTGRGTPFACPVPTIKISSNTALYNKKRNWIDFDAGKMLTGKNLEENGKDLFNMVISVASGEIVKSENDGYRDIAIFKKGVTL